MTTASNPTPATELERLARRRAAARMGWYIHATVYVIINLLLFALSELSGRHWAIFPAFGWGLGLAIHGIAVYFSTGGGGLHARMVQRERKRLQLQRDPW